MALVRGSKFVGAHRGVLIFQVWTERSTGEDGPTTREEMYRPDEEFGGWPVATLEAVRRQIDGLLEKKVN